MLFSRGATTAGGSWPRTPSSSRPPPPSAATRPMPRSPRPAWDRRPAPGRHLDGNLFLRGGGDPTFGSGASPAALRRTSSVETLADNLSRGRHSRASPAASTATSPCSTHCAGARLRLPHRRSGSVRSQRLTFNRGLATRAGSGFQLRPARLRGRPPRRGARGADITVRGKPRAKRAPSRTGRSRSSSPPRSARLIRITNKPSDNFFAEMLLKDAGERQPRRGTTAGGTRWRMRFAVPLGAASRLVDGSGLARGNRASPRIVAACWHAAQPTLPRSSTTRCPIAGRDGTLNSRMRRGPARGRCRAQDRHDQPASRRVSGYCRARCGRYLRLLDPDEQRQPLGARALQDRMVHAIAGGRD